jgi:hypothetical protein
VLKSHQRLALGKSGAATNAPVPAAAGLLKDKEELRRSCVAEAPETIQNVLGTHPEQPSLRDVAVEPCPKCGKPLGAFRRIAGRPFLVCSDFPSCPGARQMGVKQN